MSFKIRNSRERCGVGSLTRAADALGCTQSAVSHTINNLEAELGFSVITARAPELSSPPTESA